MLPSKKWPIKGIGENQIKSLAKKTRLFDQGIAFQYRHDWRVTAHGHTQRHGQFALMHPAKLHHRIEKPRPDNHQEQAHRYEESPCFAPRHHGIVPLYPMGPHTGPPYLWPQTEGREWAFASFPAARKTR